MVIHQQSPVCQEAGSACGISKMTENRSGTHAQRLRYLPGKLPVLEKICSNLLFLLPAPPLPLCRCPIWYVCTGARYYTLEGGGPGVREGPPNREGPRVSRRKAPVINKCCFVIEISHVIALQLRCFPLHRWWLWSGFRGRASGELGQWAYLDAGP